MELLVLILAILMLYLLLPAIGSMLILIVFSAFALALIISLKIIFAGLMLTLGLLPAFFIVVCIILIISEL